MKTYAVILASGSGRRMAGALPKQFLEVAGKTILEHALAAFSSHPEIDGVVLAVNPEFRAESERIARNGCCPKLLKIVDGGAERFLSSRLAISAVPGDDDDLVLIHDAARPLVAARIVSDCIRALRECPAVSTAIPAVDTMYEAAADGVVTRIPERSRMFRAQTPQGFRLGLIRRAQRLAAAEPEFAPSDDAQLVLHWQLAPVRIVPGDEENFKITRPADLAAAERILCRDRL